MRHCGVFCWPQLGASPLHLLATRGDDAVGRHGSRMTWIAPLASPFLLLLADEPPPPRRGGLSSSEAFGHRARPLGGPPRRVRLPRWGRAPRGPASPPPPASSAASPAGSAGSAIEPLEVPAPVRTALRHRRRRSQAAGDAGQDARSASPTVAAAFSISFAWMVSAVAVAVFCVAMDRASLARAPWPSRRARGAHPVLVAVVHQRGRRRVGRRQSDGRAAGVVVVRVAPDAEVHRGEVPGQRGEVLERRPLL